MKSIIRDIVGINIIDKRLVAYLFNSMLLSFMTMTLSSVLLFVLNDKKAIIKNAGNVNWRIRKFRSVTFFGLPFCLILFERFDVSCSLSEELSFPHETNTYTEDISATFSLESITQIFWRITYEIVVIDFCWPKIIKSKILSMKVCWPIQPLSRSHKDK